MRDTGAQAPVFLFETSKMSAHKTDDGHEGDGRMLIGQDIGVLGAGIAGLAAARALALRGAKVSVYERAPEIAEVGAGLQITPNGVAVLSALGLDPEPVSMLSQGVRLLDGYSGREVVHLDFAKHRPDARFLLMHRADLISLLEQGAREAGVVIHCDHDVIAIEGDEDGVDVRFAGGKTARHQLIIGADGLHSRLRPLLNGPAEPFFTGQTAWRATVPALGGETVEAQVHVAADRHVVCYPLRGGSLINIVAVEARESWAEEGWSHSGDPDEMMRNFSNFGGGVKSVLARAMQVSRWGLFRHRVAARWHSDRTALVGDAAHPTLPFLAQGANMALEDIWVLADCLGRLPLDQALPAYQARRRARVERVIEAANKNARNYHLKGPARLVGHAGLRVAGRLAAGAMVDRFSWLYEYDVTR